MTAVSDALEIDRKAFTIHIACKLMDLAIDAFNGDAPETVNHYQEVNPYESLYGEKCVKRKLHNQQK
eukprot:9719132-Ditylum_brightwellii.AAC.1